MPSFPLLRKPLWVVLEQETHEHHESTTVERHLSLFDLVSVGVGGTIGSGIFVLTGYIAHYYAGPATTISFFISGVAACCSGLCYAELAGRIPASGSTYAYAYVALGEVFAVLAASCLTLEYMVSGAAVARSWGDKVVLWIRDEWGWESTEKYLSPGYNLNPLAGILSAACVLLLMDGVKESKMVTNVVTSLKVALVVFMIVGGFWLLDGSNLTPFVPFGTSGIFRGATSSFFGYLGYDEVCCIAGEALHPARDMPRAVLWTLSVLTLLYVLAALALCGMMPFDEMSDTSAFPAAFRYNGVEWAAQVSAFGEVLTLPVVVLISLMAQPRLQLALTRDGLLPSIFGRINAEGNLRAGTLIAGVPMTLIATCIPFGYLDDLISAGILIAFSMTNACLILMRCERPYLMSIGLAIYNILCFVTGMLLSHMDSTVGTGLSIGFGAATAATALFLAWKCPRSSTFGHSIQSHADTVDTTRHFKAPFVPLLPFAGTFVNWKLISELEATGILLLLVYLGIVTGLYLWFGSKRSIDSSRGWVQGHYQGVISAEGEDTHPRSDGVVRSISMSKLDSSNKTQTRTANGNGYSRIGDGDPDGDRRDGLMRSASLPLSRDQPLNGVASLSSPPRRDHALDHQQTI